MQSSQKSMVIRMLIFKTYGQSFHSCLVALIDYCSSVWASKQFDKIDMIQNRAIRYFMGVHRFTPITIDMG